MPEPRKNKRIITKYYNADASRYPLTEETIMRREEIARRMSLYTIASINVAALVKEFGKHRRTIENDIKKIIEAWPEIERRKAEIDIASSITNALCVTNSILNKELPKGVSEQEFDAMRLRAASTSSKIASAYAKFAENRGILDVPADKIEHSVTNENQVLNEVRAFLLGDDDE